MAPAPLSLSAVEVVATTMFAKGTPVVAQAYSDFDSELRYFETVKEIVDLAALKAEQLNGALHFALYYPEARGRLAVRTIALNPEECDGATYRYACEGWGLIFVYLAVGSPVGIKSFVSANSEKRALTWASSFTDMDPPNTWDWGAVARNFRRLRGALRKVV
jgi:hypothetical protein